MLFAYPTGAVGNVVDKGVNDLIIPNYKQTWGNIKKIADAPEATRKLSFRARNTSPQPNFAQRHPPRVLAGRPCPRRRWPLPMVPDRLDWGGGAL